MLTKPVMSAAERDAHIPMTDADRELFIKECARLMEQAMQAGNRQEAMDWMQAQRKAIAERSPEQLALLVAEETRRLDVGLDYFGAQGRAQRLLDEEMLTRIELQREQAIDVPGVTRA